MARARRAGISPVQQDYLDILRSALWGTEIGVIPSDIDGVLDIANVQKTRPLVLDTLQKAGYYEPKSLELIYRTASAHITMNRTVAQLVTLLRGNGIEPVLLKGQGVAQYYPESMLRECGDIDLYVGEESYAKACELIKGQATQAEIEGGTESGRHFNVKINGVYVEIHRASATIKNKRQNAFYQGIAGKGLSENLVPVTIDDVRVNTPADSFNAFYLFYHFVIHSVSGGIGLRQICDWVLFLHSRAGSLDTSVAGRALDELNLRDTWRLYASVAVDYLGLPSSQMPFYEAGYEKRAARVLSIILKEGNFGYAYYIKGEHPSGFVKGKWFTVKTILKRDLALFSLYPEMRRRVLGRIVKFLFGGISRIGKNS